MSCKIYTLFIFVGLISLAPVFAQVELKTGTIYGQVIDDQQLPLPGVLIQLHREGTVPQSATTGTNGSFRFANLPPGTYAALFSLQGFTEVKQENIRVHTGSQVELTIILKPSLTEEMLVVGEIPPLDAKKTGNFEVYSHEYLQKVPTAHDPWSLIDQTPGIDSDRYQITQQGVQAQFTARGARPGGTFIYDGINLTDSIALGSSSTYYDFDALEEVQINTTGGISINMVTKRPGNKWAANASYYYSDDSLQSSNTPEEAILIGHANLSNRMDQITDYGFDLGGPLIENKLFVWGAYRKYNLKIFSVTNLPESAELEDFNFKSNFNWNSAHESQFNYFYGTKSRHGFGPRGLQTYMAPETLFDQQQTDSILPGVWSGQHTWIPNDQIMITARYAYLGQGFQISSQGGTDVPAIVLSAIPHVEDSFLVSDPIDRPSHDISVDVNYFKEGWTGGDHEFKFGFNYRTVDFHTFSSYGNGVFIYDYYQTTPYGPLTTGFVNAAHNVDGKGQTKYLNLLANDTFRMKNFTLTVALSYTRSTGENQPSLIPAVPGFESYVSAFEYPGGDPGIVFSTLSPQIGGTYDLTGNGKTLIRGNFGRYYDPFFFSLATYSNPTYASNGATFDYINRNQDRTITLDEVVFQDYFGGLTGVAFDLDAFLARRLYDEDLHAPHANELILGVEREFIRDLSVAVTYTHRNFQNQIKELPFGVTSDDYVPVGTLHFTTSVGTFDVPFFRLREPHDGTRILTNLDGYTQSYDGVDLIVRKRMRQNFMLNGSFTLQRERGNYKGGNSPGETGRAIGAMGAFYPFDPGLTPFLEDEPYFINTAGLYSEWQFKLNGVYQLPWDINIGGSLKYRQGFPFVLVGRVSDPSLAAFYGTPLRLFFIEPFASRRYDNIFNLDLQVDKVFGVGQFGRLVLTANVFNVTNENTVIRRNNLIASPAFNRIEEHLVPRIWRFGLRYSF